MSCSLKCKRQTAQVKHTLHFCYINRVKNHAPLSIDTHKNIVNFSIKSLIFDNSWPPKRRSSLERLGNKRRRSRSRSPPRRPNRERSWSRSPPRTSNRDNSPKRYRRQDFSPSWRSRYARSITPHR